MKTALVLSGGGSRGGYEIGVCKALRQLDIEADMVFGTSVGAITGAIIAQGDLDLAESIWRKLTTDMVFDFDEPGKKEDAENSKDLKDSKEKSHRNPLQGKFEEITDKIKTNFDTMDIAGISGEDAAAYLREMVRNGGAGNSGLKAILTEHINEDAIRKSPVLYGLVATEAPHIKGHYLYEDDIPEGSLIDYIMASASCFPAVQVFEIDGHKYIDGGYVDNLPIKMALDQGAERIIAVNLEAVGVVKKEHIKKAKRCCQQFHMLSPGADLGNFLVFDKDNTARIIEIGYLETMRYFGKFDGKKYTFEKGVFSESEIVAAERLGALVRISPCIAYNRETYLSELLSRMEQLEAESPALLEKVLDFISA